MYFSDKLLDTPEIIANLKKGKLEVQNMQILSFKDLADLILPDTIVEIDMTQNYLRYLDEIFTEMPNLKFIALPVNYISKIEYLDNLS